MPEQIIENYRIISTNLLVKAIKEVENSSERFCFILGSGASASSNIPTGGELERRWMAEMEKNPGFAEIRAVAERLREDKRLDCDFAEIEKAWEDVKNQETPMPSKYYFDIYKLRFFPNHRNGYHYLEKIMADARPSFGYRPLALMLTKDGGNNLVITTNFDSLVEDALFMYTNSKPLVINHELLADYAGDPNISRPIIAKVHRGMFFDPLNRPEETNELKGKWHDVLASVFQSYTPIVIGYGGGDNSLMELLSEENVTMKNGLYWCYVEEYGLPGEKIQELVRDKKGYLVRTAGFDAVMLAVGNALFADMIGVYETEKYLKNQTSIQIENYEKEYKKLTAREEISRRTVDEERKTNLSEDEFRKEIEKMEARGKASEDERKASDQMTAWDYWRQGNRYYDAQEYTNSVDSYSKAIALQPDVAAFYNNRGYAYGSLRDYTAAISDFDKAIELIPDLTQSYNNRGYIYNKTREHEKALADYNKAIELNPFYVNAYNNRGITYMDMGRHRDALSDYDMAVAIEPYSAEAYSNRGFVHKVLGEYDAALSDLNRAIELNPDLANPYKHCGAVWKEMGDLDKAIEFYTKAIERKPEYKEAYLNRAEVYRLMNEHKKAAADEAAAAEL